jgi:UDP-N-acetylmuramate--alanine ligase
MRSSPGWRPRRRERTTGPVATGGDPGVVPLLDRLREWPGGVLPVGIVDGGPERIDAERRGLAERFGGAAGTGSPLLARIVGAAPDSTVLEVHGLASSRDPTVVRLPTAGRHNAANALGVAAGGALLGLSTSEILAGLATFPGIGRRLERKGEAAGIVVYDDYAHHPTAIRETLLAARQREPERRIWAVYDPLTYHRTAALLESFAESLADADGVAIADIWAGRDTDTTRVSAATLAAAVARLAPSLPVAAPGSPEATAAWLAREVRPGDLVLVMGGPQLPDLGAPARGTRPAMTFDYAGPATFSTHCGSSPRSSTAIDSSRSTPMTPSTIQTRSGARSPDTTTSGHTGCERRGTVARPR